MKSTYSSKAYLDLVELLEARFKEDCENAKNKTFPDKKTTSKVAWYGYNSNHDPKVTLSKYDEIELPSISLMINKNEDVINFLNSKENTGAELFLGGVTLQRHEVQAKKKKTVQLDKIHEKILTIYIGSTLSEEDPNESIFNLLNEKDKYHFFLGAYFSIKDYGSKTFLLIFSKNKINGVYQTFEFGFHNLKNKTHLDNVEYQGTAFYKSSYVIANLFRKNTGLPLNIICNATSSETNALKKNMTGSIQGISQENGIVNAECYLIKLTTINLNKMLAKETFEIPNISDVVSETASLTLSFYLWFHRYTFLVSKKSSSIKKIEAKGFTIKNYRKLKGVYRIWQYGLEKLSIKQSKFVLNGDGTGWLYPPVDTTRNKNTPIEQSIELKKQACGINLSKNGQNRTIAVIETFAGKANIFNTAMFNCVHAMNGEITIGVFSTVGYYEEQKPKSATKEKRVREFSDVITGYFVMMKDNGGFKPDTFKLEDAEKIAKENLLEDFLSELIDVWNDKTWNLGFSEKKALLKLSRKKEKS